MSKLPRGIPPPQPHRARPAHVAKPDYDMAYTMAFIVIFTAPFFLWLPLRTERATAAPSRTSTGACMVDCYIPGRPNCTLETAAYSHSLEVFESRLECTHAWFSHAAKEYECSRAQIACQYAKIMRKLITIAPILF
jgi:hypothetical protein